MTNRLENQSPRRLVCSGCGTEFTCSLDEACWCAQEIARLPMPLNSAIEGQDCLCRDCLRKIAEDRSGNATI